jgi:hypothetical protein
MSLAKLWASFKPVVVRSVFVHLSFAFSERDLQQRRLGVRLSLAAGMGAKIGRKNR